MKFIIFLLIFINLKSEAQEPFWQNLKIPEGGAVEGLHCSADGTMYAFGNTGIFKLDKYSGHWDQIRTRSTSQLTTNSKNHIFANNLVDNYYMYEPPFLIKSTDKGITWDTLDNVWNWVNHKIVSTNSKLNSIFTTQNDRLYAAMYSSPEETHCISFSDDNGKTWKIAVKIASPYVLEFFLNGDNSFIIDHYIDPSRAFSVTFNNGDTFSTTEYDINITGKFKDIKFIDSNFVLALFSKSIWLSANGGIDWHEINGPKDYFYTMLAESSEDIKVLSGNFKIFLSRTTNLGENWEVLYQQDKVNEHSGSHGFFNLTLDSSGNYYYTNRYGIRRSTDGGHNFEYFNSGYYQIFNAKYAFDMTSDRFGNVYYANRGVYVSRDDGISWEHSPLENTQITTMLCLHDGTVLASGYNPYTEEECRIYRSEDRGNSWELIGFHHTRLRRMTEGNDGTIYTGAYKSTDRGETWIFKEGERIGNFLVFNNEEHMFTADNNQLFRSTNMGDSWHLIYDIYEEEDINIFEIDGLYTATFHPHNDTGFVSALSGYLVKTTDGGETWKYIRAGIENDSGDIEANPLRPVRVCSGQAIDSQYNIWIGASYSTNCGKTWTEVKDGLSKDYNLTIHMTVNSNGYIFMEVSNDGVYRSRQPIVSVPKDKPKAERIAIHPNPASDYIEISFSNKGLQPFANSEEIAIYDVLGNVVISTEDTERSRSAEVGNGGSFSGYFDYAQQPLRIDISHLPRGVYFVRVGERVEKFVKK